MRLERASLRLVLLALFLTLVDSQGVAGTPQEINRVALPESTRVTAVVGALLIDGRGGQPLEDAVVVVRGDRIIAVGPRGSVEIPAGADVVDARGFALLPGLIDAHFHLEGDDLPALFLQKGITSVRDPGVWIEAYNRVQSGGETIPRLFLAGPHLDMAPPAYPGDSVIVRDQQETRLAVTRSLDQGASVIKVYFRLSLDLIRVAVQTAHATNIPVTAHLETVDVRDAIDAGIDGIEHVTSCGLALVPAREAEGYRQSVLADNNARREGRYEMWNRLDLASPSARSLLDLMARRGVFLSATLAVFERKPGDPGTTETHVRAFRNMVSFTGMAHQAGVPVVVGSHSSVPHAPKGLAYQREMELLVASGMSPGEVITAATLQNARFFRIDDRLGTVEPGKVADFVLVEGNPQTDITHMQRVKRVMLNGIWVNARPVEAQPSSRPPRDFRE